MAEIELKITLHTTIKFWIDTISVVLIFSTLFVPFLGYSPDYTITPFTVNYYHGESGLVAYTSGTFNEFLYQYCPSKTDAAEELCSYLMRFQIAGYIYIGMTFLTVCLIIYSSLHLLGMCMQCTLCGMLNLTWCHFVSPFVYALGCFGYYLISAWYLMKTEGNGWTGYFTTLEVGFYLNLVTVATLVMGAIYYGWIKETLIKEKKKKQKKAQKKVLQKKKALSIQGLMDPLMDSIK